MKRIEPIKIDQPGNSGSVYINNNTFISFDRPVKILADKINELILAVNDLLDNQEKAR